MSTLSSTYPFAGYDMTQSQLAPQGWFGNLLGSIGRPLGGAIGSIFGNAGLGQQIGGIAGGLGHLLPFQVDPITAAYAAQAAQAQAQSQLAPQGLLGGLLGSFGGGLAGRALGGWLGNSGLGNTIGSTAGGILGGLLPFQVDPLTAAYAAQAQAQSQLVPQGWFGNLLGSIGQPLGSFIGGQFGNAGLGQQLGGIAGGLGHLLPFQVDPITAAYAAQAQAQSQLDPQGWLGDMWRRVGRPLEHTILDQIRNTGLSHLLPFQVDPITAAYAAQAAQAQAQSQLAPQGWFGDLLGTLGRPVGGAIGGLFGNSGLGQQIGGIAGGLGRLLPFQVDPLTAAYAAQAQSQLAPQFDGPPFYGDVSAMLRRVGQPLGGAIGGPFGSTGLGQPLCVGFAGGLGRPLAF